MSNPHFDVEVVAADRKLFQGEAVSLVAPGVAGSFGVLHGHAPFVAALGIGAIDMTPPQGATPIRVAVSGGFVEVSSDRVTVLADTAELAEEIDVERARQAKARAEERLREAADAVSAERARASLMRALNRLRVVGVGEF